MTEATLVETMAALQKLGDAVTQDDWFAYQDALKAARTVNLTSEQVTDAYKYRALKRGKAVTFDANGSLHRTEEAVTAWLTRYAWAENTEDAKRRVVACIIAQGEWRRLDARVERTRGQAWDAEQATEAEGFELSALYECHEGPHLDTCPNA
jgi:hypothetical protein